MNAAELPMEAPPIRRAHRIEDLPDDLADMLETGLDELWNPETVARDGDNIISRPLPRCNATHLGRR